MARIGRTLTNPLFPASGPATGSFNGLHAKSKFLAAIAGVATPDDHQPDGRSLLPVLRGAPPADWCDDLYLEYSMINYGRAYLRGYRTPEWKLVLDLMDPSRNELVHLAKDPAETHNLFSSTRADADAARRDLRQRIIARMTALHDPLLDYGVGIFPVPRR